VEHVIFFFSLVECGDDFLIRLSQASIDLGVMEALFYSTSNYELMSLQKLERTALATQAQVM